jgi:hypothetical protein
MSTAFSGELESRGTRDTRDHTVGGVSDTDRSRINVAITVLLTSGFFLRLLFYTGPIGSDDLSYFHFAQKLLLGQSFAGADPFDLPHQGGRLAFLALVGVPAVWFGHIAFGAFANVLLLTVRDVVLTVFVYRTIGRVPAAFAAAFLSLNPLSTVHASLMLPDGMTSFAMVASTLAAFQALQTAGRRTLAWMFLAGVLAAVAYSTKDTGILVLAPTALAILYWCSGRARLYALLSLGLGCALIVSLELLALWTLSGDPLFRVHAISSSHNQKMGGGRDALDFLRRVYWNLYGVTRPLQTSLPVLVLLVPTAAIAMFDRSRRLLFPVTGLFLALYLIFGTTSLTRLIPVPAQDRYLEPIVPYVALCLALALPLVWRTRPSLVLPALVVFSGAMVAAAAPSVTYQAGDVAFSGVAKNAVIAMEMARKRYPELEIYAPRDLLYTLEPFVEPEVYRRMKRLPDATPLPPGLYVLDPWWNSRSRSPADVNQELDSLPVAAAVELDQRPARVLRPGPTTRSARGEVRVRTR